MLTKTQWALFFTFFTLIGWLFAPFVITGLAAFVQGQGTNGYWHWFRPLYVLYGLLVGLVVGLGVVVYLWHHQPKGVTLPVRVDWNHKASGVRLNKKVVWPAYTFTRHAIVVGQSGQGKTNLLYQIICQANRKVLFINGKYERDETKNVLCGLGVSNLNFDYQSDAVQYNPLKGKTAEQTHSLIMELANFSTIQAQDTSGFVYHKTEESTLLKAVLKYLMVRQQPITINTLIFALDKNRLLEACDKTELPTFRYKRIATYNSLTEQLTTLGDIPCVATDEGGYTLTNLINAQEHCVTFDINPTSSLAGKLLAKVLQYDIKQYKDHVPKQHRQALMVIMDEFASYPSAYTQDLLEQGRSKDIALVLSLQSPQQLEQVSRPFKTTIFNNAMTLFVFSFRGDVEFVSDLIGTKKVYKTTHQTDRNDTTGRGTRQLVDEYILHPSAIKNELGTGECYFTTFRKTDTKRIWPVKVKVNLISLQKKQGK